MSWGIFRSNLDGMKEVVGPDPEMFRTYVPGVTPFWKVCTCACQLQLTRGLRKVYRTCFSWLGEICKWPFIRKTTSWARWWSALVRLGTTLQHPRHILSKCSTFKRSCQKRSKMVSSSQFWHWLGTSSATKKAKHPKDIAYCGCPEHREPDSNVKNLYRHQLPKGAARGSHVGDSGSRYRHIQASPPGLSVYGSLGCIGLCTCRAISYYREDLDC